MNESSDLGDRIVIINEPVAVRVDPSEQQYKKERSTKPQEQITDEGISLDDFAQTHQVPFIAHHMELGDLYATSSLVKGLVDKMTRYLGEETPDGMVFAVKQRLAELGQLANLQDTDAPLYKLKQMHKILMMQRKSGRIKKLKAQVLADIDNIS